MSDAKARQLGEHPQTAPGELIPQFGGHGQRPWLSVDDSCRPMVGHVGARPARTTQLEAGGRRDCGSDASSYELRLGVPQGPVVVLHRGWEESGLSQEKERLWTPLRGRGVREVGGWALPTCVGGPGARVMLAGPSVADGSDARAFRRPRSWPHGAGLGHGPVRAGSSPPELLRAAGVSWGGGPVGGPPFPGEPGDRVGHGDV
jgi:hypothetical protein